MSASSKKQLRKAQEAEKLTEKQLNEQKEAKKLKIYSVAFLVVLVLMLCFTVYTVVTKSIIGSGIIERNTVAMTVGEHEISSAELSYYYIDSINNFYNNYGSYASMFGLDTTKPLDEQVLNADTGYTWADDFLSSAESTVRNVYALCDAADAAGYTLSTAEQAEVESQISMMGFYAQYYYGYSDTKTYLKAMYGNGATEEGFRTYYEMNTLANSYKSHYSASLSYDDAAIRAAEDGHYEEYSSFSYNSYYLSVSKFDSEADAETVANELAAGEYESVADLDAAIAALEINAETTGAASTAYTDTAYSSINSTIQSWVADSSRVAGDVACIPTVSHSHAEGETHSEDEDSSEFDTVTGYYIVYFVGSNDNTYPLANVRHILVSYEGGTTDENGNKTYSDEEKAAAKTEAEALLEQWKSGKATEETFAALANENSADSDGTDGGLYENVYPGQMVTNFNDWCFDESRQPGDTGVVESTYGYHVMFYSGDSETTYRDYKITEALRSADTETWYNGLIEAMEMNVLTTERINTGLVLSTESSSTN